MELRLKHLKTTSECDSIRIEPRTSRTSSSCDQKLKKKSRFTFGYQPVTVLFGFAIIFGTSWAPTFSL